MKERFYFSRQYIHIMFSLCSCIVCRSSVDVRHSAVQQGLCFTTYCCVYQYLHKCSLFIWISNMKCQNFIWFNIAFTIRYNDLMHGIIVKCYNVKFVVLVSFFLEHF